MNGKEFGLICPSLINIDKAPILDMLDSKFAFSILPDLTVGTLLPTSSRGQFSTSSQVSSAASARILLVSCFFSLLALQLELPLLLI